MTSASLAERNKRGREGRQGRDRQRVERAKLALVTAAVGWMDHEEETRWFGKDRWTNEYTNHCPDTCRTVQCCSCNVVVFLL